MTSSPASSVAQQPALRYAAIGASDTVGVGTRDPARENWTARIARALPAGSAYARFARSGLTLVEAVEREVPAAVAFNPSLVTLWLGVNDVIHGVSLEAYRAALQRTLALLADRTSAVIALLNLPDLYDLPRIQSLPSMWRETVRSTAATWNAEIARAAEPHGARVRLVDLFPRSRELAGNLHWVASDGFHPSATGYAQLAEITLGTLGLPPAK
jgi:acyl-CoA thioesterase-1